MKYALIIAGLLASTAASATNINSPVSHSNAGASATAGASAAAGAVSGSRSSVNNSVKTNVSNRQGQIQGQAQQAQSNNQVTVTGDRNINAPGFGGFASGPCTGVGGQASVGVAGFGGGVGFTALDAECSRRESARILHMLGQTEIAVKLMMASPIVREVTEEKVEVSSYCQRNQTDYYCKK